MDLALFAVWCFLVAAAGGLVGMVLGNMRLPFTLLVATAPAAGTGANLIISAVSAVTAASTHVRGGRVNWRLVKWMAPPSIAGALVGGYGSGLLDRDLLLGLIAVVLLVSGLQLLGWQPVPRRDPNDLDLRAAVASGAVVGLLGGVVGLILGTLRMPALLRLVGEAADRAVGTNLVVGVFVGVAGAIGHLPTGEPDWTVAAVGSAASVPGALLGARLTGRLSEPQLIRAIACILLVAAASTAVQAVT